MSFSRYGYTRDGRTREKSWRVARSFSSVFPTSQVHPVGLPPRQSHTKCINVINAKTTTRHARCSTRTILYSMCSLSRDYTGSPHTLHILLSIDTQLKLYTNYAIFRFVRCSVLFVKRKLVIYIYACIKKSIDLRHDISYSKHSSYHINNLPVHYL